MPPVWGRLTPDPHDYDHALSALGATGAEELIAMEENIRYDHRVSNARADAFDEEAQIAADGGPITSTTLDRAVNDYHYAYVRSAAEPQFISDLLNGNNLAAGGTANRDELEDGAELARVLNLSGLLTPLRNAKRTGAHHDTFLDGLREDDLLDGATFATLLDASLGNSVSEADRKAWIGDFLDSLWAYNQKHPYQPAWASTWRRLAPVLDRPAEEWLQAVGVRPSPGSWAIPLRYKVEDVGSLWRPTQLDAGWHADHFPSPRGMQRGLAVDLRTIDDASGPLPEFVHTQVHHTVEHWEAAGSRVQRFGTPSLTGLQAARDRYRDRLDAAGKPWPMAWAEGFSFREQDNV